MRKTVGIWFVVYVLLDLQTAESEYEAVCKIYTNEEVKIVWHGLGCRTGINLSSVWKSNKSSTTRYPCTLL